LCKSAARVERRGERDRGDRERDRRRGNAPAENLGWNASKMGKNARVQRDAKQIKGCACKATVCPSILREGARRDRAEHNALVFNPSRFPDSRFADSTLSPFLGRVESRSAGNAAHNSRREPRNPVKGFLCVRDNVPRFLLFFPLWCFFLFPSFFPSA